ncbi:MAG: COX15/CtaA family protein, partial [Anaerolineae bacterium]|nr:COX15/CtaA family protein [Anaerolineae bacterium]
FFPFNQGQLALIHMTHRYAVAALGLTMGLLVWYVYKARTSQGIRRLTILAFVAYLMQAGVGALYVLTSATVWTGVLHVALAATTWALLVSLSVLETLNSREIISEQDRQAWNPQ